MIKRLISLCLISVLLFSGTDYVFAEDYPEELKAGNILSFTKYCAEQEDFYRACSELDRLNSYYPAYLPQETYLVSKAYYLYRGRQYDAVSAMKEHINAAPSLSVFAADSCLMKGKYSEIPDILSPLFKQKKVSLPAVKRSMLASALLEDESGLEKLERLYAADYSACRQLSLNGKDMLSKLKSPAAGAFLGIIPGAGYIYADNSPTGLAASAVTVICGILSFAAYRSGSRKSCAVLAAVGFCFYGGNIVGGYLETKRYNRSLKNKLIDESLSLLETDREEIYTAEGIGKK